MFGGIHLKKLFGIIILCFILYIIYYDVRVGTLPTAASEAKQEVHINQSVDVPVSNVEETPDVVYQEIEVKAGDTVLSIVEKIGTPSTNVSISNVIDDFEQLNPGEKAAMLQIGQSYKFPIYQEN